MKQIKLIVALLTAAVGLSVTSCQYQHNLEVLHLELAVDKSGIVKNHTFDGSKSIVVTHLGTLDFMEQYLRFHLPPADLKEIVAANPEFEFAFYLKAESEEEIENTQACPQGYFCRNF